MNRFMTVVAGCALVGVAFGQGSKREVMDTQEDPPAIVQWARGHAPDFAAGKVGAGKPVSLLTNHGGPILTTVQTKAIFWGSSWATDTSDKITGIDSFFNGVSGTSYIGTNSEYGGAATGSIQHSGHVIDSTAAPGGSPSTGVILGEVCKMVPNPDTNGNGFYAVYIDKPRGHASYCAWHSKGSCGGTPVQFAFFFKLDGDAGCDPGGATGTTGTTTHSQGLAAIANVTGHELSETVTDPHLDAWFDGQGQENADKCAWTFGSTLLTFSDASTWKIQGNWSNNAYQASTGYAKGGCIDR